MSSTSPSSLKRSTSSTASKKSLKKPPARTSTSQRRATKLSSESELSVTVVKDIWDALFADDPTERERQRLLGDLSSAIRARIVAKGWTQREAAKVMGVTQPRISDLVRDKLDVFSIDSLVAMAGAAGIHFDLRYKVDP